MADVFQGNPADIHMGPAALFYNSRCLGYTLNDSVKINIPMTPTPVSYTHLDVYKSQVYMYAP